MPSGFVVANSPIVGAGTLVVTGGPVNVSGSTLVRISAIQSGGATANSLGLTTSGFTAAGVLATTSWLASMPRGIQRTAIAAGSQVSQDWSAPAWLWLGNAAGTGGFGIEFTVGLEIAVATTRIYAGLSAATLNLVATEPSANINCVYLASDSGDANLQIMHNDGAGACTKVNLGASFPASTTGVAVRVVFQAAQNASSISYSVTRLDAGGVGAVASGTLSTNLPVSTVFMKPVMGVGNAATAAAASFSFIKLLIEEFAPA